MSRNPPPIHGYDHTPHGPDPIPAPEVTWPTWHLILPWIGNDNANYSDYAYITDVGTSVTGAYAEATTDGAAYTWPVRLGPYGSVWEPFVIAHRGTDFGKVEYQFGTANENEYGDGRFTLDADTTFVTHQIRDFYNGTPILNEDFTESVFRIKGADGDELTTITGSDPDVPAAKVFNGGAGFYLFRLLTNGHHASSSGYKVRLISLMLRRVPG